MSAFPDYQLLFAESPEVLLVLLPDAPRFTMVAATNARWRATHTSPATLGQGLFEVFPDNPDDPDADGTSNLRASLERVLKTRQPDTMPVQKYDIRGPDGLFQVRYWSPKNLPVLSPAGEVLYILHRVEDVTELVRASEMGERLRGRTHEMELEVVQRSRELADALEDLRAANARLAEQDAAKTTLYAKLERELERRVEARTAEVARLTRVLQMLSGINTALVRIRNRDEVVAEACRLAHRTGGYALAMVALIDPVSRVARPAGWAGFDFLSQPSQAFPVADREERDTSLMGRVIRTGVPVLCEDIRAATYPVEQLETMIVAGVRSLACIPLHIDGTPVGAFLFGTRDEEVIRPDEMRLLEELAGNLSFALQFLDKQDAVHFLSYFEPLTGLAKRSLFCERLNRLLARGSQALPRLAVTVFDLMHLAVINDSLGRHTGDRLLQCVAERLREHFPDTEQLCHLGGGTFACVRTLPERTGTESTGLDDAITRLFSQSLVVDGRQVQVEVKSGVACYPEDGREASRLVQNAEAALKVAKTSGERYLHHRLEMNAELVRRVSMEQRLRGALESEQFVLYYQPKVSLGTGEVRGVEALLRWVDPEQGVLAPGEFLPLLESSGLMPAVGAWALRQAAADCRLWRRSGAPPVRIAVNCTPAELRRRNVAREILDIVGDLSGPSAWGIDLEITEGALAGDASACIHTLRLLRASGMNIAIDDFGTGYSSLGRLSQLPIDTLKIDRSFTARLPADRDCCTLVSSVIALAHAFGMSTVAEGVETREQFDHLLQAGCDESQGYFHSPPLPRSKFEAWLLAPRNSRAAGQRWDSGAR